MEFTFNKKAKLTFGILMIIGVIAMIYGYISDDTADHNRFWANIFINGFFYFSISLGALFFLALQYATEASYMVVLKRVFEAVSHFIYIGSGILVFFFLAGTFQWHSIYEWMNPDVFDLNSDSYDALIAGKSAYLNKPFFWIRTLLFLGIWCYIAHLFRKRSLLEDELGGTKTHFKNITLSAIFIVFFGFTSSIASWDWIMSIDAHWFSTLFGWYVFSGMWVSALIFITLLVIYLKGKGYLEVVNKNHLHDLGKWVFAISFLWSYLWFSQFLLIWYSNIPEEVVYFIHRIEEYKLLFFGMFFINFVFPMVMLMSRDSKRMSGYLIFVGSLIFVGHWLDVYVMVIPGGVDTQDFGFLEIGMGVGFLGLFLYTVFNALTKAPMVVKNHPYLEESKQLHI